MSEPKSWAGEVQVAGEEGRWHGNGCRFPTAEQARWYVGDLAQRWTLVVANRVVPSEDEPNYVCDAGVIRSIPGDHEVRELQP